MAPNPFYAALKSGVLIFERKDDDMYDRISSKYSVGLIMAFITTVGMLNTKFGEITCNTPSGWTAQWTRYANSYCLVANKYYLPPDETVRKIEGPDSLANFQEIPYYQWVPVILMLLCLLYIIPGLLWELARSMSGLDSGAIVKQLKAVQAKLEPSKRDTVVAAIAENFNRLIKLRQQSLFLGLTTNCSAMSVITRILSRYFLSIAYTITKSLYLINVISQFFIMDLLLGVNFKGYGSGTIAQLSNQSFVEFPSFPLVVFCDIDVRNLGDTSREQVECLVPMNTINEKIFLIYWFWLVFVALSSALGLLLWLVALRPSAGRSFVRARLLSAGCRLEDTNQAIFRNFVDEYLAPDGVFFLRVITRNVGDAAGCELAAALFLKYEKSNERQRFGIYPLLNSPL